MTAETSIAKRNKPQATSISSPATALSQRLGSIIKERLDLSGALLS